MKMKNKIFAIGLTLTLMLTLLPVLVAAAIIPVGDATAFGAAVTSAADGDTIQLTDSIDYNSGITVSGKTITIDVDSFVLNIVESAASTGLNVGSGGTVLLDRTTGTFNVTGLSYGVYTSNGGVASVTNATATGLSGYAVYAETGGSVTVGNNATATGGSSAGVFANGAGSTITVNGAAQGTNYGVYVIGGAHAFAISATATSNSGYGAYARSAGSLATVDDTAQGVICGAYASSGGHTTVGSAVSTGDGGSGAAAYDAGSTVTVNGDTTATGAGSYGALANSTGSMVTVTGTATGTMFGLYAYQGGEVTANNATATGADGAGVRAYGAGSTVTVDFNATATGLNGFGASAANGGEATINGSITADRYIMIGLVEKLAEDGIPNAGYMEYSDTAGIVRVLIFSPPPTEPSVSTSVPTGITSSGATLFGDVTSDGGATVSERGFVYSMSANPVIGSTGVTKVVSGSGTGNFSASISDLMSSTLYYYRAYATNSEGTSYGEDVNFTTAAAVPPTVVTNVVSSITPSGAALSGDVTSDGGAAITERGFVYSTSVNPTTTTGTKVTTGSGTGIFTTTLSGLAVRTTYHVRAYAINSEGTVYGTDISFTTAGSTNPPTGDNSSTLILWLLCGISAADILTLLVFGRKRYLQK